MAITDIQHLVLSLPQIIAASLWDFAELNKLELDEPHIWFGLMIQRPWSEIVAQIDE